LLIVAFIAHLLLLLPGKLIVWKHAHASNTWIFLSRVNFARASEAQFIEGEAGNPCQKRGKALLHPLEILT